MSNSNKTSLNNLYLDLLRVAADSYKEGNKQFIISKYNELSYSGSKTVQNILNKYTTEQDIQNNFHSIMLFFLLNSLVKDTSINIKDFVDKMNAMAKQLRHKEVAETKQNVKSNVKQNFNQRERTAASVIDKYDYIKKQDEEIAVVRQKRDDDISNVKKKYDELMKQNDINELIEMEDVEKHFKGPEADKKQIEIAQKYDNIHKELQSEFDNEMTYIKNRYESNIESVHETWTPFIERQNNNNKLSSQSAGSLKKTDETVKVNNKTYKVYLGKRGGKYVKKDGKFLSLSKLN
jgi:hypothetical protein